MVKILLLMLLTQFSFYFAPVTHSRRSPDRDVTLEEVYSYVTGPAAKDRTIELRGLTTKEEKDDYKKQYLDYCSFSGRFGECRKKEYLIQHSGLLMLDIDNLPVDPEEAKAKLLKDTNFTPLLIFTSPKGNGLKVAVQIDTTQASMEQYVEAFHVYLKQEYGYEVDTHCKDVARACFLPWDPAVVLNNTDDPVIFDPQKFIPAPKTHKRVSYTRSSADLQERVENVINEISKRGVSIAPSYEEYLKVGFAFADSFGEAGRNYFHDVCFPDPKYDVNDANKQYTQCLMSKGSGITIASFFGLAKEHGIDIPHSKQLPISNIEVKSEANPELPVFSERIRVLLPKFGQDVMARFSNPRESDIITLGWLAIMSAMLPGISGIYDETIIYPHIYVFVEGYSASGKGKIALLRGLTLSLEEDDKCNYLNALLEYEASHKEWEESDRHTPEPQRPSRRILCIPADSTAAAFETQLVENGGEALIIETEADTLVNALSSPYGHFSGIFRKAYHHELVSRIRNKEKEYTNIPEPKIAVCLTGTPNQTSSLVKGIEDGLASRFIYYHLPESVRWRDPFLNSGKEPLNIYYKKLGKWFFDKYYLRLLSCAGAQFRLTHVQQERFNSDFKSLLTDGVNDIGYDIASTIFRLGLTTFRIAMILTVIRAVENDIPLSGNVICDDQSFQAAMEISKVVIEHDIFVLSSMPKNKTQFTNGKLQTFHDALPARFTREVYQKIAVSIGFNPRTVDRYVRQMCAKGMLQKLDTNIYVKL